MDICIPNGNEAHFIERAQKLGLQGLLFLYPCKNKKELAEKKLALSKFDFNCAVGLLLEPKKQFKVPDGLFHEAELVAVRPQGEAAIRAAISNPRVDLVFGIPTAGGRDHIDYRRSSWNEIFTGLAKKNKVAYGVDFGRILELDGARRARLLGREMQNVRLIKGKAELVLASFARDHWHLRRAADLVAFGTILGLQPKEAKQAVRATEQLVNAARARKSKEFVLPGVRLISG